MADTISDPLLQEGERRASEALSLPLSKLSLKLKESDNEADRWLYGSVLEQKASQLAAEAAAQPGTEEFLAFTAKLQNAGEVPDNYVEEVLKPLFREKTRAAAKEGVELGRMAEATGEALGPVAKDLAISLKALAKYGPQALVGGVGGVMEQIGIGYTTPEQKQALELFSAAAEQGTRETGRLVQRGTRKFLSGAQQGFYVPEGLTMSDKEIDDRWDSDLKYWRRQSLVEAGERDVGAIEALLFDKDSWNRRREDILEANAVLSQQGKPLRLVPPTWEEHTAASKAARPKLSEEQKGMISPVGELADISNAFGFGFGTKAAKAILRLATEKALQTAVKESAELAAKEAAKVGAVRTAAGNVVEGAGRTAGKLAEKPLIRGVAAATVASAAGADPVSATLAALLGTSRLSRVVAKGGPEALEAVGKALKTPLPAPFSNFVDLAKSTGAGAIYGGAGMTPFVMAADSPEERGALLAGGLVYGGAGGGAASAVNSVKDFGKSYWSPEPDNPNVDRAAGTAYGTPYDGLHAQAAATLNNGAFNRVEALRALVKPYSDVYLLNEKDYNALNIPGIDLSQGVNSIEIPGGRKAVFVKMGGSALSHEVGEVIFDAQPKAVQDALVKDYMTAYPEDVREQMRQIYEQRVGFKLSPERAAREVLADNFHAAFSGLPITELGTKRSLAGKIYGTIGQMAERLGLRDMTPGGGVVTSDALEYTPSFILRRSLENVIESMMITAEVENNRSKGTGPATPGAPVTPPPSPAPATPGAAASIPAGVQNVEAVIPPPQPPGFKKGDPIGNITDPQGQLVFTGAKVWADAQGDNVRIEGVDQQGNLVRADVPRAWLESPAGKPPVDVGVAVPVPADLVTASPVPVQGSISGVPAAPVPAPATPSPAARPNVRVTTEQQDNFTAPTPEQVEQNRATLEAAAGKPRNETPFFEANILGAKTDETGPDAVVRREQRRLADALEKHFPDYTNPLRAVFQKIFAPFKYLGGDNPRVFGFSFDKLIQNMDVLTGWQIENPNVTLPYKPGDPQVRVDLQTYLRNQANGYAGGGDKLARPSDTRPGTITPENPDYTPVRLPRESVEFFNLLMGFEPPQKTTPAAEYFRRFAEQNGLSTGYTPTGSPDTNALRVNLRKAGFNSRLLNSVVENLPIRRIAGELKPRPDIDLQAGDTGITQAGFMPERKDTRVVNIGLNVPGGEALTEQAVLEALKAEGLEPTRYEIKQSSTEPTLIAEIPAAEDAKINRLAETLGQEAIAVYNPATDTGVLVGPKATKWGEFNKDFFLPLTDEKPAMMPTKAEGSMGRKKLKFVNYSNNPTKKTLDPLFFGRSGVTPTSELSGKPRAYAYLKGSPLGGDKGLIDTRKFVHEGTVDGSKIYDGVADVLDYGLIRNREQADQMLLDKGFIGIYREGQDGRQQIEFLEPVDITSSKENKPLVEDDVEAVSSLSALPLEDVDYQAMDAEFARKRDAGEPLYMPKATEVQEQAFEDSKVRAEDGTLKPVFHFTDASFERFGRGDLGYHFGTAEQAADRSYTKGAVLPWQDGLSARAGSRTIPVFLNLKNPLRIEDVGGWSDAEEVYSALPFKVRQQLSAPVKDAVRNFTQWRNDFNETTQSFNRQEPSRAAEVLGLLRDGLKTIGYDGVVYRNTFESKTQDADSYIAFDNDQIMPAFAKDAQARFMPATNFTYSWLRPDGTVVPVEKKSRHDGPSVLQVRHPDGGHRDRVE